MLYFLWPSRIKGDTFINSMVQNPYRSYHCIKKQFGGYSAFHQFIFGFLSRSVCVKGTESFRYNTRARAPQITKPRKETTNSIASAALHRLPCSNHSGHQTACCWLVVAIVLLLLQGYRPDARHLPVATDHPSAVGSRLSFLSIAKKVFEVRAKPATK